MGCNTACYNHIARQMNASQRKAIALQAINNNLTKVASANQVSRNFVYGQKDKALLGIEQAFNIKHFFQRLFLDLSGYRLYFENQGVIAAI